MTHTTFENKHMNEQQGLNNQQQGPGGPKQGEFRFRNYHLIRRIDVGGMGEVYLARQHTAFDREVAIKIIRSDLVHDMTVRKRFRREAEVNAHVKHGHILSLVEFGEEEGRLFFVTPYIAGGTLSRRLQTGPLALSEVYQLFTALVEAVAYIHRRGVVHRDLKPGNILLDHEDNSGKFYVYLIDFGIASIQGQAAEPPLTTAGTEMGTLAYMAPERLSGIAAPSNDIYSLGIILYQMLTGQLPSSEQRIPLPQPLEYVVDHCIAPLGQGRFTSAEEVLSAFEYAYQYLNASGPQKIPLAESSIPPQGATITPTRVKTSRPVENLKQEVKTLQRSDDVPVSRPPQPNKFAQDDYEAPTTNVDVSDVPSARGGSYNPPPIPSKRPSTPKARTNPIFAIVTLLIVVILLVMAGLFFFEFQSAVVSSASVNFSPQVHTISQVFSLKGSQAQTNVDVNTLTIPVKTTAPSSQTGSQTGDTTRQCILFVCQQVVTQDDVNRISDQLKQKLDNEIAQTINHQLQSQQGVQVGAPGFTTTAATPNPPVGSNSKTVTVTMTEQGQAAYILNRDAQQLARLLLQQQVQKLGPNFVLINSLTQIGKPVVVGTDSNNGLVFIKIAAAGVAQYQFPTSELHDIQATIKGMKIKNAVSFVQQEQGVDSPTVNIHLNVGDTLPGDPTQIKVVPVNPTTFPGVQLTPIPVTPTATS
jgi:serine/threonine protein kinase